MSFPLSLSTTILLLLLTTTSHGYPLPSSIFPLQLAREIHLLRPRSGISGHHVEGLSCLSWRLGVETNNVIGWKTIPEECEGYVGNYMLGERYHLDSEVVIGEAMRYADGLKLAGDGKDVWVFDVDETTLSNLPYYAKHGFGLELFNATAFNKWVMEGKALVLPESFKLYKKVVAMGIKPVFLTGRTQDQTSVTGINLNNVGYNTWEKLILK
ncbi:Acid phosphatase 1 [Linum perenne]